MKKVFFLLISSAFFCLSIIGFLFLFSKKKQADLYSLKTPVQKEENSNPDIENLPWQIYPQAKIRVNNKLANDNHLVFSINQNIYFDAFLSLNDYRLEKILKNQAQKNGIKEKSLIPPKEMRKDLKSFYWSFGDWTTAKGEKVFHSYSEEGTYLVSLSVEHQNGNFDTASCLIQIGTSKESQKFKTFDFENYYRNHPEIRKEKDFSKINPDSLLIPMPKNITEEKEKIAILIDAYLYKKLSSLRFLIEGKNPLNLYIEDVQKYFPNIEIFLVKDKNWKLMDPINCSPQPTCRPEYDIKNTLRKLYFEKNIKGAILVGLLPYFKWYQKFFFEEAGALNLTVCQSCYEDLDGLYLDLFKLENKKEIPCKEGELCDGYFDYVIYQPTGKENPGPEIWVSWIRPLVKEDRSEEKQIRDFFYKVHNYYLGKTPYVKNPVLVWHRASPVLIEEIKNALLNYFLPEEIIELGGPDIFAPANLWFEKENQRYQFVYIESHGSPEFLLLDKIVRELSIKNLQGRSLMTSLGACSAANFHIAPKNNISLALINYSPLGLAAEGNGVVHSWFNRVNLTLKDWFGERLYFGAAWAKTQKSFIENPCPDDYCWVDIIDLSRNLPSEILLGNPFIFANYNYKSDYKTGCVSEYLGICFDETSKEPEKSCCLPSLPEAKCKQIESLKSACVVSCTQDKDCPSSYPKCFLPDGYCVSNGLP